MAQRVSPVGRVPGNPLGGVLRDLSRASRPTGRPGSGPSVLDRVVGLSERASALEAEVSELRSVIAALVERIGKLESQQPPAERT